ncbi:MAG: 6-phospho-beta-glucosidase [Clostridiales bacterium]|jgi:6-phospho-beta-glucosidase|nr:6-phospho-beta-glucosidase [Clostridiales bacterium]
MKAIRVAIIGAGSVYTPELLDMMGQMRGDIQIGSLCLMDTDPARLSIMTGFTRRFLDALDYKTELSQTADRLEAIKNADFIITQIRVGGNAARVNDEKIPMKYGLLGQETTGAGGFAKALRTAPVMVDIARDVEQYNPGAWVINYTNPTGIVAEAVTKHTKASFISLCGGGRHPGNMLYKAYGIEHSRVRYDFFGLNHFNFSYNITIDGRPITDEEFEKMAEYVGGVNPELTRVFGAIPSLYVPYFYNKNERFRHAAESEKTRGEVVQGLERELYELYADPDLRTKPELLSKRGGGDYAEMALGVISAIANNRDTFAVCNVSNNGAIPFLPTDAVVETACMVNASGARPLTFKSLPGHVWGMVCAVKNYESLTVEAAMGGSRVKALQALLAHPLVMDYDLAAPLLEELLNANQQYLPRFFS